MSKHSKEPWSAPHDLLLDADGNSLQDICGSCTDEDLRRIVQCVNAMAGIEDPEKFMQAVKNALLHVELAEDPEGYIHLQNGDEFKYHRNEALALFPTESEEA